MRTALVATAFGTFAFEHAGMLIHYPVASECGRFPCTPEAYGFAIVDTGGGCTAWRRDFTLNGEPVFMLVTAIDDASHEIEPGDPVAMGVYDDSDSRAFVLWTQGEGTQEDTAPQNITRER